MIGLKEYLQWSADARRSLTPGNINGYSCLEDFVLKHGRAFTSIGKMPKGIKRGRKKQCFMNATHLCHDDRSLTYCEGYAVSVIPMMHAWCVTRKGVVIDPTWTKETEYYGVPIKRSYLMKMMRESGVYGVIDLWKEGWPILKAKPEEFIQSL